MQKKYRIYLAVSASSFIQGLQISIAPVLGAIAAHYRDTDISLVQMLVTFPAFVSVFSAVVCGWLAVKLSKKSMLLCACLLTAAAGLLPLLSDSFALLFSMRAVYGLALGCCATLNAAVVSELFEGEERVSAMGLQAASIGAGMMLLSALSGWLGRNDFTLSYYTNAVGFLSFLLVWIFLPDTGRPAETGIKKTAWDRSLLSSYAFIFVQMMLVITFPTNISMHLSGALSGDSRVSGLLTGAFAGSQILVGAMLASITRIVKRYVLPFAMLLFSLGAFLLVLFPDRLSMLLLAALLCGFSQGIYIPSGFIEAANAAPPAAVALAGAGFHASACIGQSVSPYLVNMLSRRIFGELSTGGVYSVAALGLLLAGILQARMKRKG